MSNQKYDLAELREKCSPDKVHCSIGVRQLAFVFEQYDAEKSRADALYNKLQIASLKAKQDELAILKEKGKAARAKLELERAEKAEAMVDWLADKLPTESQNCRDLWRGPEGVERTMLYATRKEAADAFAEAARRAVADADSGVLG